MKTDNQLDKLIAEYKQDRKKHPIKWMWKDFKWWVLTSINWVRIKLTKKTKNIMRIKCITFDKQAQDSLPEDIKKQMKADRDKARKKGKNNVDGIKNKTKW